MINDIKEFHEKYELPSVEGAPCLLTGELAGFRFKFMHEELEEYRLACFDQDLSGAADALVDLVYVVLGTAHLMGLPFQELWDEVHAANMRKVRAEVPGDSKRGSTFDVVKPKGWYGPDIQGVLFKAIAKMGGTCESL